MGLSNLKSNFAGKAAAAGIAAAIALTPLTGAFAEDKQQNAEFTEAAAQISAPGEAARWSMQNNGGVGVAISMGTQSRVTPAQVEQVIRRDFASNGVTSLRFFYDRISSLGTAFSFHVDGGSTEVLTLGNVRNAIPVAAADAKHMAQYPELARN
ncbi:hypothetical protein [Parasphingorhabdus flavimaris]|uniref:hypothetical protein n=1 Tax=Parasphingorhabdus flavimaris TaxID=266812 RepID=UPI00300236AF